MATDRRGRTIPNSGYYRRDTHLAAEQRRRKVTTRNDRGRRSRGRRRRGLPRLRLGGPGVMLWSTITILVAIVALIMQSLAAGALALTSLGVTVVAHKWEHRQARAGTPPPPRRQAQNTGKRPSGRGSGSSGTPRPRRPSSGGSARVCSEACQKSPKSKNSRNCRCQAPDCKHGSKAGLP